ncbi:MAG: ferrous iron transport protein B [Candidatus Cloacimonadaceae bacterium]
MNKADFSIALIGNPNVGKTTVFNILTGSRQTVGNWPGVTVEHKEGRYSFQNKEFQVIDLPGIYSLAATTLDEKVTRNYILQNKPDLLVNVVDASNLERNLYLTLQLLEMKVPLLVVLTMLDIAEQNRVRIELEHLQRHLGCSVVPMQLFRKQAENTLREEILKAASEKSLPDTNISYDEVVEDALVKMQFNLDYAKFASVPDTRWLTIKLLEQDEAYLAKLSEEEKSVLDKVVRAIEKHRGQEIRNVIADDRYAIIHGLSLDVIKRRSGWQQTFSDKIDTLVLSSWLGLPLFFFVMFIVFSLTIKASQPLVKLINAALGWLFIGKFADVLNSLSAPLWLTDFLSNGIGGGLVVIASFIPPILFIFISLAWLEDSGYMARAAFVADKFMRRIGLPGKAFIPLLVGFGCTVPAIMATRTLENKRDRIMTSLLTPFMSCGAKLPVYTFLAMIFFPKSANIVVFGLYMIGIVLAMLTGLLLKKTLFKSKPADFVMELPAYHLPTLNGIMMHAWHRLKDFILRAGKTILLVIVAVHILQMITIPVKSNSLTDQTASAERISLLEIAGKAITPVFQPFGIAKDNWQASVALLSGLLAKEAIVGSLQSLYETETGESIQDEVRQRFGSGSSGFAYLLFILLYSPCAAALTMLWKEHGKGWMTFAFVFLTLQAWLIATLFYQITQFGQNPARAGFWFAVITVVFIVQYIILFIRGKSYAASF